MKLKIVLLAFAVIGMLSCNNLENKTQSGSKMILTQLTGTDLTGEESATAFSDVITGGSIYNDSGNAYLQAVTINPNTETPTYYQNIIVDQIDVEYFRTDGQNTEGVDVPFKFVQPTNQLLEIGTSPSPLPFVLVRHVAKIEPPLIELRDFGAEKVLEIVAKVTIHGKDIAGYRVEPVIGYLTVWCANFADSTE